MLAEHHLEGQEILHAVIRLFREKSLWKCSLRYTQVKATTWLLCIHGEKESPKPKKNTPNKPKPGKEDIQET